jgi:hypothetical protein
MARQSLLAAVLQHQVLALSVTRLATRSFFDPVPATVFSALAASPVVAPPPLGYRTQAQASLLCFLSLTPL